jgi:hypothetical protein
MKKLTEQEFEELKTLRETFVEIITTIGELNLTKFVTEKQLSTIETDIKTQQEKFVEFQAKERVLFEKFQQKYGTGDINLETGEIAE